MSAPVRSGSYAAALIAGLSGGVAVVVGVSHPWFRATASPDGLPRITATVDGADVAPLAAALAFVVLAGFGAVVATGGRLRRAVGVVIVVCAATILVSALVAGSSTGLLESSLADHGWSGGTYQREFVVWRWVVIVGAAVCVIAGLAVARQGHRWATMGSRYEAPAAREREMQATETADVPLEDSLSEADLWKAIDRGHDPTQTS